MSVALRRQRDGKLRPFWYGEYIEANGKRTVLNLGKWRGTPSDALLGIGESKEGDPTFEASRKKAEEKLKAHADEARRKGRAEHLTERLIEAKTGRAVEYARLTDLGERWRGLGRETPASEAYLKSCDAAFDRFVEFMKTRNPEAVSLYEVTPADAGAHMTVLQKTFARKSVRDNAKLLNKAFERFLPVGAANPFSGFIGRRAAGESETVHRKPFTDAELRALLDTARDDEFMYPLIVTAACSGMRRGDVCNLSWSAVDLAGGMLTVKTSKTGADVEIPIFKPLRAVLEARKGNGNALVFPEAARLLETKPDALTWQFKKIVVRACGGKKAESGNAMEALPAAGTAADTPAELPVVPAAEVLTEGEAVLLRELPEGPRRDRMLDVFRRYCGGTSLRRIVKDTGHAKTTVSHDLRTVQGMIGKQFLPGKSGGMKEAVRLATQVTRAKGQRAASIRDWHALRSTFVTLALSAGVPVELVRRVTGHATVEVVLKHYFRPDREQFKAALVDAMPKVLTGRRARRKPMEELAEISGKLADGTATDKDKERFRDLAAKV